MKVKDLINELKKLDGDIDVFVDGYEDGFDLITNIEPQQLYKADREKFWCGNFHQIDAGYGVDKSNPIKGMVLFSNRRRQEDED